MDAITLLKKDHHTVEQLFKRFEQAGDRAYAEKRRIVDRIIEELSTHAAIEEQLFYPASRASVPDTEDIALESIEEHHVVKWELAELEKMDPRDERFDAKVAVLIENVRHHVEEEENEFFPKVREELGRNDLNELGDAMEDARKLAPTHPHPRSPQTPPANLVVGLVAGAVDRVGDTAMGVVQGTLRAAEGVVGRVPIVGSRLTSISGSSRTRQQAERTRRDLQDTATRATDGASAAAKGAQRTARAAAKGATSTARTAKAGAKGTATSARKGAEAATTTARRGATSTGRSASAAASSTRKTASNAAKRTKSAAS